MRALLPWFPAALLALNWLAVAIGWLTGGLTRVVAWYLAQLIPPGFALVYLLVGGAVVLKRRRIGGPGLLTLALSLASLVPLAGMLGLVLYPVTIDEMTPHARVRLPLDAPILVGWGGDRLEANYHAGFPDQRWAYDLLVEPVLVGSERLEDYGCYGEPVLAPAAGVITVAHDGEPDAVPGQVGNTNAPLGNHVAIRLEETGTHLLLAHLKPDSVAVAAGDVVAEGQPIGACGNTGRTSEPHVHIHHQRQDPAEIPVGVAEGLPLFFRDHGGPEMPEGGLEADGDAPRPIGDRVQHGG